MKVIEDSRKEAVVKEGKANLREIKTKATVKKVNVAFKKKIVKLKLKHIMRRKERRKKALAHYSLTIHSSAAKPKVYSVLVTIGCHCRAWRNHRSDRRR